MDCNFHDVNLASVKTDNLRDFFYNNIKKIAPVYNYIYLWLSRREYNNNFVICALLPKRQMFEFENFIYEVVFDNNYMEVINEISETYEEFQQWELCFTNREIKKFSDYDGVNPPGKTHTDGISFHKGIENDVVWIKSDRVEAAIVDFV